MRNGKQGLSNTQNLLAGRWEIETLRPSEILCHRTGFLDMQKNLAFRIVKANRTVLKDILCEVLHLEKNYLQRQNLSVGLLRNPVTCQTVKESLLAKSFIE